MKKMQKKQFRIGELAKKLNVETSVIRFWEKEFNIKSNRSEGKQRFFTQNDFDQFATIKELLYIKKYTIAGAKEELKNKKPQKLSNQQKNVEIKIIPSKIENQILELQEQLIKLKELLGL